MRLPKDVSAIICLKIFEYLLFLNKVLCLNRHLLCHKEIIEKVDTNKRCFLSYEYFADFPF